MPTVKRLVKGLAARVSRSWMWLQGLWGPRHCQCNCCGAAVAGFYSYGGRPFGCPYCQSSTRERWVLYSLDTGQLTEPAVEGRMLHVAPSERSLIKRFGQQPGYHPVDLFPELYPWAATEPLDLMALNVAEEYRLVYLSHVMEHVPDDSLVLSNLYRALKPGGEAWLLVPLKDAPTREGRPGMSASEREREFGQWDHARQYGPDFQQRLESVGFAVRIVRPDQLASQDRQKFGLDPTDWIFVARKSSFTTNSVG